MNHSLRKIASKRFTAPAEQSGLVLSYLSHAYQSPCDIQERKMCFSLDEWWYLTIIGGMIATGLIANKEPMFEFGNSML